MGIHTLQLHDLASILLLRAGSDRLMVGIAGPPGAGKSTFCELLQNKLNTARAGVSAILPMDGFHYDDIYLNKMGWRAHKGAPYTFDIGGFAHILKRLRADKEPDIAVPVFDRALEIARAGARVIPRSARIILVEGNYLLLNEPPWRDVAKNFDISVMLRVRMDVLEQRLGQRWVDQGMDADQISVKLEDNDLPNARLVLSESVAAEYEVETDG